MSLESDNDDTDDAISAAAQSNVLAQETADTDAVWPAHPMKYYPKLLATT